MTGACGCVPDLRDVARLLGILVLRLAYSVLVGHKQCGADPLMHLGCGSFPEVFRNRSSAHRLAQ